MSMFFDVVFALIPLLALLIPIVALIVLYAVLAPSIKNRRATNDIPNTDTLMQQYLFKTGMTRDELVSALEHLPVSRKDKLTYSFSSKIMLLTFSYRKQRVSFSVSVCEYDGVCYVHLSGNTSIPPKSKILYYVNPFMVEKLGLEAVDYDSHIKFCS